MSHFDPERYRMMYSDIFESNAQPIEVLVHGTDTPRYMDAVVSRYAESDLIEGGSIQLGDLRVMLLWEDVKDMPALNTNDRIIVDGRNYGVIHWDEYTRAVGPTKIAVEVVVRGGGGV